MGNWELGIEVILKEYSLSSYYLLPISHYLSLELIANAKVKASILSISTSVVGFY
jgi:hypothetical protein